MSERCPICHQRSGRCEHVASVNDFETVHMEGDDGEIYEVPAPVARKLIHVEQLAYDIIGVIGEGKYPEQRHLIEIGNLREELAMEMAKKIRASTGKFQMMREAVAQWIEEGGWKDE